jgi:hypothetical protein
MQLNCLRLFVLLLFFNPEDLFAQITYPDSCLKLEFYYRDKKGSLDTTKSIKLKKGTTNIEYLFWNDSVLNMVVLFRNICNQDIAVPSAVQFGTDFWIEGVKVDNDKTDTLEQALVVDYWKGSLGTRDLIVHAKRTKLLPYPFPLGLKIRSKGLYRFRLIFNNSHNYIPFDEWKTYYSNWLYLKLL